MEPELADAIRDWHTKGTPMNDETSTTDQDLAAVFLLMGTACHPDCIEAAVREAGETITPRCRELVLREATRIRAQMSETV